MPSLYKPSCAAIAVAVLSVASALFTLMVERDPSPPVGNATAALRPPPCVSRGSACLSRQTVSRPRGERQGSI